MTVRFCTNKDCRVWKFYDDSKVDADELGFATNTVETTFQVFDEKDQQYCPGCGHHWKYPKQVKKEITVRS